MNDAAQKLVNIKSGCWEETS